MKLYNFLLILFFSSNLLFSQNTQSQVIVPVESNKTNNRTVTKSKNIKKAANQIDNATPSLRAYYKNAKSVSSNTLLLSTYPEPLHSYLSNCAASGGDLIGSECRYFMPYGTDRFDGEQVIKITMELPYSKSHDVGGNDYLLNQTTSTVQINKLCYGYYEISRLNPNYRIVIRAENINELINEITSISISRQWNTLSPNVASVGNSTIYYLESDPLPSQNEIASDLINSNYSLKDGNSTIAFIKFNSIQNNYYYHTTVGEIISEDEDRYHKYGKVGYIPQLNDIIVKWFK